MESMCFDCKYKHWYKSFVEKDEKITSCINYIQKNHITVGNAITDIIKKRVALFHNHYNTFGDQAQSVAYEIISFLCDSFEADNYFNKENK